MNSNWGDQMTSTGAFFSNDIEKAAESLKRLRPAYENLIEFYMRVFIAQEEAEQHMHLEPVQMPRHLVSLKAKEGFPLIRISEFVIDKAVSNNLFNEICRIALDANETLTTSARRTLDALISEKIDLELLFENLLNENDSYFEQVADDISIEKKILVFFTYNSMKPSLKAYAQAISIDNRSSDQWEKGFCPVCGSFPGIATLENGGGKFLFCNFCCNKWRAQRIFCPFCETEDQKVLQYFYNEEELEYRVDTCNECKKYIKTVDVRNLDRIFYPPLEQISTLHLDMKAEELGFTNPSYLYQ